jgi:hypothetical protein
MSDEDNVPEDRETLSEKFKDLIIPGRKSAKKAKQKDPSAVSKETQDGAASAVRGIDAGPLVKGLWDK